MQCTLYWVRRLFVLHWLNNLRALKTTVNIKILPSQTSEINSCGDIKVSALHLYPSWVLHTARTVCHIQRTDLSLTHKSRTVMMDSDLVMTCSLPSPLVCHQLGDLSINWPYDLHVPQIMYRLSSQLMQPLQLSINYHNCLSRALESLPLPLSISTHTYSRSFFPVIDKTIKSIPHLPYFTFSFSFPCLISFASFKPNDSYFPPVSPIIIRTASAPIWHIKWGT